MNGTKEKPRSCGNSDRGGELDTNNYYITHLTPCEVERMFGCSPEELCPDMLVRLPEMLVVPEWESW